MKVQRHIIMVDIPFLHDSDDSDHLAHEVLITAIEPMIEQIRWKFGSLATVKVISISEQYKSEE